MSNLLPPGFPATLEWTSDGLRLLDQTLLPAEETYITVSGTAALIDAIQRLVVRGAPALGCAGGYGVVLAFREAFARSPKKWQPEFKRLSEKLADARPTAVNLRWAVERCCRKLTAALAKKPGSAVEKALLAEAVAIHEEDREMCDRIGQFGAALLPAGRVTVMTHCNAGALATGGSGTALAVLYAAHATGTRLSVFCDETRPLLQGARLTSWELTRAGIAATVICDSMAAMVMRTRRVDACIVGADRIAANGDTANKIGTCGLAILARHHGVPFYVAAPSSTFDLTLPNGTDIPIEERNRNEIAKPGDRLMVPDLAKVYNPAFDVTSADLITAIVTERGILRPPYPESIVRELANEAD
jgi:methylthioribose-1-phosphate isomerase